MIVLLFSIGYQPILDVFAHFSKTKKVVGAQIYDFSMSRGKDGGERCLDQL